MEEITIRDIARICGVGVSTVSRAINNHPDINPETKEMIMRVIKENNYVPNNSARNLKRQDANSVRVINMPTIKPLDEEIVLRAARECHKIITVEEHSVIGGLGEAVCSLLSEKAPTPVRRIGVQDKFGHSGPAWEVLRDYGLTADAIADAVRSFVKEDQ